MDCEHLRELIPAYCINATDPEETRQIQDALTRCPDLVDEIARFRAVDDALLNAAPQVAPPSELLGSLMRAARETSPVRPAMTVVRPGRPVRRWIAAAAALALFVVLNNVYWISRLEAERAREIHLPTAVNGEPTGATARVIWSSTTGEAVLIADNFPNLSEDTNYQAWMRRGDTVISLGVFVVDENGVGTLTFTAENLDTPFDVMGVTTEPRGGSPAPTSPPVVRWQADA